MLHLFTYTYSTYLTVSIYIVDMHIHTSYAYIRVICHYV